MSEETMKENKAIRILFQKLTDEKYKQRECKNVFIISVVPKGFKIVNMMSLKSRYFAIVNIIWPISLFAALSKLYIFDDNIYFLNDDFEDGVSF